MAVLAVRMLSLAGIAQEPEAHEAFNRGSSQRGIPECAARTCHSCSTRVDTWRAAPHARFEDRATSATHML